MLPATLAIISTTFQGRERATAFAPWGATVGVGVALGPVLGGFLTTNYSWRWAFGINVIVAPLAILGALLFMRRDRPRDAAHQHRRPGRVPDRGRDVPARVRAQRGRALRLVPTARVVQRRRGRGVAVATAASRSSRWSLLLAVAVLFAFYKLERWKERTDRSPLFEFGQLRHRGFRYGLITTSVLAMGQLGMFFVLPVFLQDAKHLSAETNGFWMLPVRRVHHHRVAARRLPHALHERGARRATRPRARGRRAGVRRVRRRPVA